jgi:hypothetical protein
MSQNPTFSMYLHRKLLPLWWLWIRNTVIDSQQRKCSESKAAECCKPFRYNNFFSLQAADLTTRAANTSGMPDVPPRRCPASAAAAAFPPPPPCTHSRRWSPWAALARPRWDAQPGIRTPPVRRNAKPGQPRPRFDGRAPPPAALRDAPWLALALFNLVCRAEAGLQVAVPTVFTYQATTSSWAAVACGART